ncbi:VWA domain-containing protein [Azospirillum sp. SYSU D00513]|uniref:VWA domain-containing protein n=1 Tax=Azospirillum sp. SYSU D00513 TaxID=2812561 RepID=UPI001A95B8AE|nr:VWA domain-containing protein [Azospirillum sp. SYSU D00513]
MADHEQLPARQASQGEVDSFLRRLAAVPAPAAVSGGPRGRLIFAMDATASREPSWDQACRIQGDMFTATAGLGGLDIQLAYYRGFGECKASPWVSRSDELLRRMAAVRCAAGRTQIGRLFSHALKQTRDRRVNALVFVGDCMEEDVDELAHKAGQLGLFGVPLFVFHEGSEPRAARAFRTFARLSGGAYCPFDASSARQLRDLLSAVAVYAAGGRAALEDYGRNGGEAARLLTSQLGGRASP